MVELVCVTVIGLVWVAVVGLVGRSDRPCVGGSRWPSVGGSRWPCVCSSGTLKLTISPKWLAGIGDGLEHRILAGHFSYVTCASSFCWC